MGLEPRTFGGVRIVPLTRALATHYRGSSRSALSGDGSCSLENMRDSCFASEACNRRSTPCMTIEDLLSAKIAFVAVDGDHFVGCVSASDSSSLCYDFPHCRSTEGLLLSNLCVSKPYRRYGVGKLLIAAVVAKASPSTYLLVARVRDHEQAGMPEERVQEQVQMRKVFEERVQRLFATYRKLSFENIGTSDTAFLFQYLPLPIS